MKKIECCPNSNCGLPARKVNGLHWHESLNHPTCNITNWVTPEDLIGIKERMTEQFPKRGEIKFGKA